MNLTFFKNPKNTIFFALLLIVIIIGWVYYEKSLWTNLDNQYISKIKTDDKRMVVVLKEKRYLSAVVNLNVFGGISPVSSFDEATKLYGEPNNIVTKEQGYDVLEYWRPLGRVDIIRQKISEGGGDYSIHYFIESHPNNFFYDKLFNTEVSSRIISNNAKYTVVIKDKNGELIMVIIIQGTRIDEIIW